MTSSQLAAALTTDIVDMNSALTDEQRLHLLAHFRQIAVDSLSSFLGIIDGSSGLSGHDGDFELRYADAPVGSGNLQDAFLQHIEDSE
jgi:hypothetical protein